MIGVGTLCLLGVTEKLEKGELLSLSGCRVGHKEIEFPLSQEENQTRPKYYEGGLTRGPLFLTKHAMYSQFFIFTLKTLYGHGCFQQCGPVILIPQKSEFWL